MEGGVLEGGEEGLWVEGEGLAAEGFAGGGIADVPGEGAVVCGGVGEEEGIFREGLEVGGIEMGGEGAEVGDGLEGLSEAEEVGFPALDEEVFPGGGEGEVGDGFRSGGEEDGGCLRGFP